MAKSKKAISFICSELITCGAILSTFELTQALRKLGYEAYIVSDYRNPDLEDYFDITPTKKRKGITVAVSPKCKGKWAYVRTKDNRWLDHKSKKIAVSPWIANWLGTKISIGNGTHERFYDMREYRDIEVLIEGNYEPNKNIEKTIEMARGYSKTGVVHWLGRNTRKIDNVKTFTNIPIKNIPKIYNRTKVFIKMSREEGWNRPVAEARACGVPLIINQSGGNRNINIESWENVAKKFVKEVL